MCLGMFVSVEAFESLIRKQEDRVGEAGDTDDVRKAALAPDVVRYIKCPECKDVMNRTNYARISGVIVDYCRRHGYWLDNGELEKIAAFVASGGLKERYRIEMEEAKSAAAQAKLEKALAESSSSQYAYLQKDNDTKGVYSLFDILTGLFDR
jgi:Zn-finger nucleic acid-binding protein